MLEMLYRLILGFSREKAVELHARYQKFSASVQSMHKTKDSQKVIIIGFLEGMSRMIGDVLGPILTMELK
jgi:hypothetical protein